MLPTLPYDDRPTQPLPAFTTTITESAESWVYPAQKPPLRSVGRWVGFDEFGVVQKVSSGWVAIVVASASSPRARRTASVMRSTSPRSAGGRGVPTAPSALALNPAYAPR